MREQIEFMEFANYKRREDETTAPARGTGPDEAPDEAPDFPPPLPRPEYATSPGIIGRDDAEIDFYVSCKQGRMDDVAGYIETCQPPNAVRQYGLEHASFGGRAAVARYLLEGGAMLHGNVFTRAHSLTKYTYVKNYVATESTFDGSDRSQDIIALLESFLDAGWHPTQPWFEPQHEHKTQVFCYIWHLKPVVKFLIERVPGLRIESRGVMLRSALRACDAELLDILLPRGADATLGTDPMLGTPLLSLAERHPSDVEKFMAASAGVPRAPPVPFPRRRATAEWLLQHGARVNDVVSIWCRDTTWPSLEWVEETALSLACRAEDYEFAEWLLEKGADPELLQGRALQKLWWNFPNYGDNDPNVARELVEKVRARHGGKLPAEAEPGDLNSEFEGKLLVSE